MTYFNLQMAVDAAKVESTEAPLPPLPPRWKNAAAHVLPREQMLVTLRLARAHDHRWATTISLEQALRMSPREIVDFVWPTAAREKLHGELAPLLDSDGDVEYETCCKLTMWWVSPDGSLYIARYADGAMECIDEDRLISLKLNKCGEIVGCFVAAEATDHDIDRVAKCAEIAYGRRAVPSLEAMTKARAAERANP